MGIGYGVLLRLPGGVDKSVDRGTRAILAVGGDLASKGIQFVRLPEPARRLGIPHRHVVLSRRWVE